MRKFRITGGLLGLRFAVTRATLPKAVLTVTELEPQHVPSGQLPWPVPAPAGGRELAQVYGQFADFSYLHFHSGIDIAVPKDTAVTAIEDGTVYNQPNLTTGDTGRVTIDSIGAGGGGWTYYPGR